MVLAVSGACWFGFVPQVGSELTLRNLGTAHTFVHTHTLSSNSEQLVIGLEEFVLMDDFKKNYMEYKQKYHKPIALYN